MSKWWAIVLLFISGCIGTDEVDDPLVGESIVLQQQLALLTGHTAQVQATYRNQFGIVQSVVFTWSSSDEAVASVDALGQVTAINPGQAQVVAAFGDVQSMPLLVTVVDSEDDVANVTLSSAQGNQIGIGQQVQLLVSVSNILGIPIEGLPVTFVSLDTGIISVNAQGMVTGLSNGLGRVVAQVGGIQSNTLSILVGNTSRTGTFTGANGYDASGSTELFIAENGDVMLRLSSDFDTDFALGTFIYLSNSTAGMTTRNEGLEIQEISSGGAHLFNVSAVQPGVIINQYAYVIVLCKPAAITFGFAQLLP